MAGYLGKISAVVTANTTDFTRNIGAAREEIERFARSTRSSVNSYKLNFDTTTLDRTLTKLQLFRRTLQEAANLRIDTGALDQLYEVTEDLSKPLIKVKNEIEGLGNSVQAQLYPAMERAQRGVQRLFSAIADGSTTLQAESRNIAELTRQITLLGNSTAAIKDLENLGKKLDVRNSGATFLQPRAQESLKRSDVLRGEAAKLSPETRADAFWQTQADMAERNAARIAQAAARVERYRAAIARAAPGERRDRLVAGLAAAESQLDSRVDRQNRLNAQMELGIAAGRMRDSVATARPTADADSIDAARVRLTALQATLRSVRPDGAFDAYAASLAAMADNAARAAGSASQLRTQLTQLNAAMDAGERLATGQQAINAMNAKSAETGARFADGRAATAQIIASARAAGVPAADVDAAQRKNYLSDVVAPRLSGAGSSVAGLAKEFQSQLSPRLKAAQAEMERLLQPSATPAIGEIRRLRMEIDGLERDILAAEIASKKLAQFDAATAMNMQPRAVQDFQHDFQMLLNLAGQLNDELGTRMAGNLERSRARAREIVHELADIQRNPATPASTARRSQLLDEIRGMSRQLAAELAQLDPTRFTEKQINRLLSANRRLRGDISGMRGSAMAGQMALQQLTFAVDDFFSATGGLEYKLRAVSNNISQFGFILGGTAGLIAGVAATVGTQLLIQFGGIGKASKESEAALKFLNEELSKSQNLAQENAKAFKEMAKAVRDAATASPRGEIEQKSRELRENMKKQREADVLSRSPQASEFAGKKKALEDKLESAAGSDRIRIRAELETLKRQEESVTKEALRPRSFESVQALLEQSRQAELGSLSLRQKLMFNGEDTIRSKRFAELQAEKISRPTSTQDALKQVESRLEELRKTQAGEDFLVRFVANAQSSMGLTGSAEAFASPGMLAEVRAFKAAEKQIAELDAELARLRSVIREGADGIAAQFAEQALVAKEEIADALKELSSIGIDADLSNQFAQQFKAPAAALATAVENIEKALREDPSADITDLKAAAEAAAASLENLYAESDRLAAAAALGATRSTRQNIESAAGNVSGISVIGTNAARMVSGENGLLAAERRLNRAVRSGDEDAIKAAESQIEGLRKLSEELLAASHAVAAFQKAAEAAALNLSSTLLGEASSDAERARRRANRLAGTDMEASSAADRAAAEQRKREAEDFNRQIEADMNAERIKFEREKGGGGRVGELQRQVDEGRIAQGNKELSTEQQAAGKAAADKAEAELQRILESRLKPFQDKVDARDAVEQARLERARRHREDVGREFEFGRAMLGDAAGMAKGNNNFEAAVRLRDIDLEMAEAQRKLADAEAAGVEAAKELIDEIERLGNAAKDVRDEQLAETITRRKNAGAGFDAQTAAAKRELERSGVFASDVQGAMTENQVRRESLVKERDELLKAERDGEARAIQNQIDAMDAMAMQLNAAAIAVAAFQDAATKAALALQSAVAGESNSAAVEARREANRKEALFGANAPEPREARDKQKRLEDAARAADDERRRAESAIADERVKFEKELADGKNPAAKARADEIARLEQEAADQNKTPAEREAARARANELRAEQEREFEARPEVQAERRKADEADRERKRVESADRGRELMKTPFEKQKEQLRESAADIGNAVKEIAGAAGKRAAAQKGANALAEQAAPMFAQFRDEVLSARLNGPSRAALTASDIQSSQGASELNRLLRGDDPNKNVNLVEMRKQSELLKAIEKAILDTTGQVVEL